MGNNKLVIIIDKDIKKLPAFFKNYVFQYNRKKKIVEILLSKEKSEVSNILQDIKKNKFSYADFTIKKRSLESIFLYFFKKKRNDKLLSD